MTVTIPLADLLAAIAAFAVVLRMGAIANVMNGTTDHWLRAAGILLAVGALAMAVVPLYPADAAWCRALFAAGVAAWMYAEKRRNYS